MQRALLYAELIYAQAKTNMDESIGESQEAERLLLLPLQFSQTCDEKLELFAFYCAKQSRQAHSTI